MPAQAEVPTPVEGLDRPKRPANPRDRMPGAGHNLP